MPLYDFVCRAGHVTEKLYSMNAKHPQSVRCGTCLGRARRIFFTPTVVPDFPEHYNWSFGCVVKNRAHHRQLQQERGVQDWEPLKDSSLTEKQRKRANF
jgi:hypothetical protein